VATRPPKRTVLFWGEKHPRWKPLSNFVGGPLALPHPFTGEPTAYATVEHYFQACKATDAVAHDRVRTAPTPKEAKRRGRAVALRHDWEDVKRDVMLTALRAKFQDPALRELLLATGTRTIGEDSPYDHEWGIRDRRGGYGGQNLLGQALMRVRAELTDG
jgi:N-glycosidase YbiA